MTTAAVMGSSLSSSFSAAAGGRTSAPPSPVVAIVQVVLGHLVAGLQMFLFIILALILVVWRSQGGVGFGGSEKALPNIRRCRQQLCFLM